MTLINLCQANLWGKAEGIDKSHSLHWSVTKNTHIFSIYIYQHTKCEYKNAVSRSFPQLHFALRTI